MTKLLIIGVDGATWKIIKPNLNELPTFKRLIEEGRAETITLGEDTAVMSPAIWCSMFSGVPYKQHKHKKYIENNKLVTREDIPVKFAWDLLDNKIDIRALQVPFVMPPYNHNCKYEPIGFGASKDENELDKDTDGITFKALEILKENPDCFIVVFNALDRIQHFHWGEPMVLGWYKKIDKSLGMLEKYGEKLVVISDHGFCGIGEARIRTLPDVSADGQRLKGDHHEEAILITRNVDAEITKPEDVFKVIMEEFR